MEYNMGWYASPQTAPYFLTTDLNDIMLNGMLEAPLLSDPPRSVSLMTGSVTPAASTTTAFSASQQQLVSQSAAAAAAVMLAAAGGGGATPSSITASAAAAASDQVAGELLLQQQQQQQQLVAAATAAAGGGASRVALIDTSHVPAATPDLSSTIAAHAFSDWTCQDYNNYEDSDMKPSDMEFDDVVTDHAPTDDDHEVDETGLLCDDDMQQRRHNNINKKPKVHLDPQLKLNGPITYEKNVDPSVIPIAPEGMARCEKCGAIGVRHAFYTRARRFCSLRCARSVECAVDGGVMSVSSAGGGSGGGGSNGAASSESSEPNTPEMCAENVGGGCGVGGDRAANSPFSCSIVESVVGPPSHESDGACSLGAWLPRGQVAHSFNWDDLMARDVTLQAAPVTCFQHAPLSRCWHNVCVGMKVEVPNGTTQPPAASCHGQRAAQHHHQQQQQQQQQYHQCAYWVATVLRIEGYRGLVRYEGYDCDSSADFWVDLCSDEVHPVGWCALQGQPLIAPPAVSQRHADCSQFLVKRLTGARTLPSNFHHKVLRALGSQLREGQIIEVVDKSCMARVRAACISQVIGRRLFIRYLDAPADDGGFWCHENSPLVHPVGWAVSVGHRISAPKEYLMRCETTNYLPNDATQDYLPTPPPVIHEGFKVGMMFEAIDPLHLSVISVATVCRVLASHYLMIRLETASPPSLATTDVSPAGHDDWFCYHANSPYIFPAGFAQSCGLCLRPPSGHCASTFNWTSYVAERRLVDESVQLAPAHLFHRPAVDHGFKVGHKLEAVDLMDPQLVCVATVSAVCGRLLRVHFDGWHKQFDEWLDYSSPDIFPLGWCRLVGYKLEPPRAPVASEIVKRSSSVRAPKKQGGRGGRAARAARQTSGARTQHHVNPADDGDDIEGEDDHCRSPSLPFKRQDNTDANVPALNSRVEPSQHDNTHVDSAITQHSNASRTLQSSSKPVAREPPLVTDESSVSSAAEHDKLIPCLSESASATSSSAVACQLSPDSWSVQDVVVFLRRNECAGYCDAFAQAHVDGRRLLALTKHDLLELVGWKVGPSVKIENLVQKLRSRLVPAQRQRLSFIRHGKI